jgi:hypothetical protein
VADVGNPMDRYVREVKLRRDKALRGREAVLERSAAAAGETARARIVAGGKVSQVVPSSIGGYCKIESRAMDCRRGKGVRRFVTTLVVLADRLIQN